MGLSVRAHAGGGDGGVGVPLVMSMSHRPYGDWASDITVVLSEEESSSPQNVLHR